MTWIVTHYRDERGVALVEFSLILALVTIVALVALKAVGDESFNLYSDIGHAFDDIFR